MRIRRVVLAMVACLSAHLAIAQEPECEKNFRLIDGQSSETTVDASGVTPETAVNKLSVGLSSAGVVMQTTEPRRGLLKAVGLDVKAETTANATRVTFHSSTAASKATLCRYAGLLIDPPMTNDTILEMNKAAVADGRMVAKILAAPSVSFDVSAAALEDLTERRISKTVIDAMVRRSDMPTSGALYIAGPDDRSAPQIKADLLTKGLIKQEDSTSNASFRSHADFLEFAITGSKVLQTNLRQYDVSILVPHANCEISHENATDVARGFAGQAPETRTNPVRLTAKLTYRNDEGIWWLSKADITRIEGTK